MVQPPQLTAEQRQAALEKAARVRRERAELKIRLKSGQMRVEDVFADSKDNAVIGKLKVRALLMALPGIGGAHADSIMKKVGISPTRRVAGLGSAQKAKLLEILR